jgi:negative regulator of sigma-B (phosphoserine phosphatase)
METIRVLPVESGVASFVLPGQSESGDHQLVRCKNNSILIAAVDGIGHGEEAANAAKAAISILESGVEEPIISLVTRCHERLRSTRGIVLSLASVDTLHGMMTWLGVGNVQGVLLRAGVGKEKAHEELLLRGGVVGSRLPPLQATVLPIAWDDTLVFVTDGVRGEFIETLSARESPQRAAERILEHYGTGIDDALVLVARFSKPRP